MSEPSSPSRSRWTLPPELRWFLRHARPFSGLYKLHLSTIVVVSSLILLDPLILKWIIDDILPWHRGDLLLLAVLALLAAQLFRHGLEAMAYVLDQYLGQRIAFGIRMALLRHAQVLSEGYYTQRSAGDTLYRLDQDVEKLEELGGQMLASVVRVVITTFMTLAVMAYLDWRLTLMILFFLPAFVVIRRVGGQRLRRAYDRVLAASGRRTGVLQEQLAAVPQIQLLRRERHFRRRFFQVNRQVLEHRMQRGWVDFNMQLSTKLVTLSSSVLVLGFGGYQVLQGRLTVGGLVAFMTYLSRIFNPLYTVVSMYSRLQRILASMSRVIELSETTPEIVDRPGARPLPTDRVPEVTLDGVVFGYAEREPVLRGISLGLEPGEKVALVGASGEGKSTLGRLLTRLREVDDGSVRLDGHDLRDLTLDSVRGVVTLVPQDATLFDLTLAENLRLGNPKASDAMLWQALRRAGLASTVEDLPQGLEEPLGPRGGRLSGGQRQRLALARALLQEPRVLILDEATAALDGPTEKVVLEALDDLVGSMTVVVIAHRLSAIRWADRILVLDQGTLAASGTHETLYRAGGVYRRLCDEQFVRSEEDEALHTAVDGDELADEAGDDGASSAVPARAALSA